MKGRSIDDDRRVSVEEIESDGQDRRKLLTGMHHIAGWLDDGKIPGLDDQHQMVRAVGV